MNNLEHLLSIVGEECDEIGQSCSKAARFGMDNARPNQPLTNAECILSEFNDLVGAMELLFSLPVDQLLNKKQIAHKQFNIAKYMDYSRSIGTLVDDSPVNANHSIPVGGKFILKVDPDVLYTTMDIDLNEPYILTAVKYMGNCVMLDTIGDLLKENIYENKCYIVKGIGLQRIMLNTEHSRHLENILSGTPNVTIIILITARQYMSFVGWREMADKITIIDCRKNK